MNLRERRNTDGLLLASMFTRTPTSRNFERDREMYELRNEGWTIRMLAAEYGLSCQRIEQALRTHARRLREAEANQVTPDPRASTPLG